jgi:two-component system, NtrC family, response regulator AtoC
MNNSMVWVVDDDAGIRAYLADLLAARGYGVCCLDSGEQLLRRLGTSAPPALLLLDIRMPRVCGLEVLSELDRTGVRFPSIVLSGDSQIPTVVQAMRLGALDYLVKPIEESDLETAMQRALGAGAADAAAPVETLFQSASPRMRQIQAICDKAGPVDVPMLILGESGAGKEVLARYIHSRYNSREPFVKVNCAALPAELLESELFGHERGAFTGALREKPGKFELAGKGTIMLDEVAEMSPLLQAKLLHVLQDGEYSRLGGTHALTSRARIIAATNKHLSDMVAAGTFREDLYFRLNVITIEIPPLRERPEDIPALCSLFIDRYGAKFNSRVRQLPAPILEAFRNHHWPGNVRELENAVKRFLILPDLQQVLSEISERKPPKPFAVPPRESSAVSLKDLAASASEKTERELIFQTLNEVNWNRKEAARRLGICYKSLLNKLHRWQSQDGAAPAEREESTPELRATA